MEIAIKKITNTIRRQYECFKLIARCNKIFSEINFILNIINLINSKIKYGISELFFRLVNLRDSDEQTNAPISPTYAHQYNQSIQVNSV